MFSCVGVWICLIPAFGTKAPLTISAYPNLTCCLCCPNPEKAFWCGLKKVEMDDLRCHACLPQLREVARILHERFGAWTAANANRLPCAEVCVVKNLFR